MTSNSVSAKLDAVLDPLNSITEQLDAAADLAFRNKLPAPFIATIKYAIHDLHMIWETLNETATALDPDRAKDQL